jgi:hypothetical protein
MRLHAPHSWLLHRRRSSPRRAAPAWWLRLSVARLRNPLDQFIVTIELVSGAVIATVGAGVLAATTTRWPWAMVGVGLAIVAIALTAILRARDGDGPEAGR